MQAPESMTLEHRPSADTGTPGAAASRVLVLDADAPAGLASVQVLGRAGAQVHAAVRRRGTSTAFTRWAARLHLQPAFEPTAAALEWLLGLDAEHGFVLVVPSTEGSLRWLRALPEGHGLRRRAQLPDDGALDLALDKSRTTEFAASLGIPVPRSRLIAADSAVPAASSFPAVLKPVRSKVVVGQRLQSLSVAVVRSSLEREQVLAAWLPFTEVQEQAWVPGHGVGVEMLFQHGRMVWSFVHERLHESPLSGGASTLRRSAPPNEQLIEWSRRLLERLSWHGVAMIEWRVDAAEGPRLMEINPRLWGSLPLTIASGRPVPLDLLRMALGERLEPPAPYRVGVRARNPEADLRWFLDNLRADHGDPMLLTEPVLRAGLGWLRALWGGETWDAWHWDDPRLLAHKAWRFAAFVPRRLAAAAAQALVVKRRRLHHRALVHRMRRSDRGPSRILILCYGNICRSPFAELLLRRLRPELEVASAGLHAVGGRSSPAHVVQAARAFAVDLSAWSSHTVSQEQVDGAELILAMDGANWEQLTRRFPAVRYKITQLGFFRPGGGDIEDPYDMDPAGTVRVLRDIEQALANLSAHLGRSGC